MDTVIDDFGTRSNVDLTGESNCCLWKEITNIHSPSETEERKRIEDANGWITTETEIPIGQLRRMDFLDEDVIGILKRCFNEPNHDSERTTKECKAAPQRIIESDSSRAFYAAPGGAPQGSAAHRHALGQRVSQSDSVHVAGKRWL